MKRCENCSHYVTFGEYERNWLIALAGSPTKVGKPVMALHSGHLRFDPLNRGGLIWITADSFSDGDELLLAFPDCHCECLTIIKAAPDQLTLDDHGRSFKLRPWAENDGWLEDPKSPYGLGQEWTGPSSKWTIK